MRFIDVILDAFFPPKERMVRARSFSFEQLATRVHPVRLACTDPRAVSLLPYRDHLVQSVVTEAKFHDARRAQDALGAILAEYLAGVADERAFVLLPIPLSRARLRERGYNQAERICKAALRHLEKGTARRIRLDTAFLHRSRDTQPQTTLDGRARRLNLQGAFHASGAPDPHTLYMVVDDVITTGATLSAACEALKAASIAHILPIALAHSP